MNDQADESIRWLAHELRRHGLATPAMMVVDAMAPFGFVGEQLLFALGSLLPLPGWREVAHCLVLAMRDDRCRYLIEILLNV